ncbi:response regulator transcription factor [Rubinisphaera margarita]|uniref:response regulator transcription factor n=1 Tax=Rubinisphaera margarita TaxID=2909586 RepID=UPI001EE7865E|nr:LuxR C-terminal-related transcriptional regulator [Rubinisphaera margarita]MCG6154802.1 LuxR C-terminal-related transcriptional regulator [Rubinisphaera margarita]
MGAKGQATVFAVFCEDALSTSNVESLQAADYRVRHLGSVEELSSQIRSDTVGCILVNRSRDGQEPEEVLQALGPQLILLPVVVLSPFITVDYAVSVLKAGAWSALIAPCEDRQLLQNAAEAVEESLRRYEIRAQDLELIQRFRSLDADEFNILEELVQGRISKEIALQLDISTRTVDRRKRALFDKLEIDSLADLLLSYLRWQQIDGSFRNSRNNFR